MEKELKEPQLIEIYDLVFSKVHSNSFKAAEAKSLLFEPQYYFLETPKVGWKSEVAAYLDKVGFDRSQTNL